MRPVHEPPTPFATSIAKYFQNSIREDGLLARAQSGVIYVQGNAGTLQEVFQDAAQNYYRSFEYFSPMVSFDADLQYWQGAPVEGALRRPVKPLLDAVFLSSKDDQTKQDYGRFVTYVQTEEDAVRFIERHEAERAQARNALNFRD